MAAPAKRLSSCCCVSSDLNTRGLFSVRTERSPTRTTCARCAGRVAYATTHRRHARGHLDRLLPSLRRTAARSFPGAGCRQSIHSAQQPSRRRVTRGARPRVSKAATQTLPPSSLHGVAARRRASLTTGRCRCCDWRTSPNLVVRRRTAVVTFAIAMLLLSEIVRMRCKICRE
jgi:hypothetical protein